MPRIRTVLAGLTALHMAIGVWIATSVPGPLLSADDLAYLGIARTLAGHGAAPLAQQPPYSFLYPVLLAPGWLFGLGEGSMLTWARVMNAALASLMLPALYLLSRRVLGSGRRLSLAAAVVGSILPAALLTSSIVWTENLLALLVVASLLAVERICRDPGRMSAVLVVASAVALHAAHPRMAPVAIVIAVSGAALLVGRVEWPHVAGMVGAVVAGMALTEWVRRRVQTAALGGSGNYTAGDLASRRGFGDLPEMIVHAMGATAYLVLAGAGLAALGAVALWRSGPAGRAAMWSGAVTVAMAGWFLTGVGRSDAYLHGRYVEVFAPVLVSAGIVSLTRLRFSVSISAVAGTVAAAGVVAAWAGPGNNWVHQRSPVMMLGVEIAGAPFGAVEFEPGAAASVALLVGLTMVLTMRTPRLVLTAVTAALAVSIGTLSGLDGLDSLYQASIAGNVEQAFGEIHVDRLMIADESIPPPVWDAVAWRVGFDSTTTTFDSEVTHLLLGTEVEPPSGSVKILELVSAVLWELPT